MKRMSTCSCNRASAVAWYGRTPVGRGGGSGDARSATVHPRRRASAATRCIAFRGISSCSKMSRTGSSAKLATFGKCGSPAPCAAPPRPSPSAAAPLALLGTPSAAPLALLGTPSAAPSSALRLTSRELRISESQLESRAELTGDGGRAGRRARARRSISGCETLRRPPGQTTCIRRPSSGVETCTGGTSTCTEGCEGWRGVCRGRWSPGRVDARAEWTGQRVCAWGAWGACAGVCGCRGARGVCEHGGLRTRRPMHTPTHGGLCTRRPMRTAAYAHAHAHARVPPARRPRSRRPPPRSPTSAASRARAHRDDPSAATPSGHCPRGRGVSCARRAAPGPPPGSSPRLRGAPRGCEGAVW